MLKTEMRNPKTINIDKMSTEEMINVMQEENLNAAKAVDGALKDIGKAVDGINERMSKGGRLFYVGCGTSGRLGVLDASECPPTYGVSPDLVIGVIAGGDTALRNAVEGAEDSFEKGTDDISAYNITANDTVVGISAAGGAAYVLGALHHAKTKGALTVAVSSNPDGKIIEVSDIGIYTDTGPEVVTGSTRMKAGTAQKLVLNMISTAVMIKQGYVYENFMINLKPSNIKLRKRMISIVSDITGKDAEFSEKLLEDNDFVIKKALAALAKENNNG